MGKSMKKTKMQHELNGICLFFVILLQIIDIE